MKTSTLFRAFIKADRRLFIRAGKNNIKTFERYSRLVGQLYNRILARLEARDD
jgi:precorrin-6x reductase